LPKLVTRLENDERPFAAVSKLREALGTPSLKALVWTRRSDLLDLGRRQLYEGKNLET